MRFTVKSPAQIETERRERQSILPVGTYDISIRAAQERVSKSGNPMLEVIVVVYHDGGEKIITDYLLADHQDKIYSFACALGVEDLYHAGEMRPEDLDGRTGKARIGIEGGKPDGKGGNYPDKNRIAFYVNPTRAEQKPTGAAVAASARPATANAATAYQPVRDEDDDIPF